MLILKRSRSLDANPVLRPITIRQDGAAELEKLRQRPETLSAGQKAEALAYWNAHTALQDPGWIDFYHARTGRFDPRFVPYDIFYGEIDRVLNPPYRAVGVSDKALLPRLFPGVRHPRLLVHKAGGALWDGAYAPLDIESALNLCREAGRVVCKAPVSTCGGYCVRLFDARREADALSDALMTWDRLVVQLPVRQHPAYAAFNTASVNTLRIITYQRECGEAVAVSSVLRMGAGDTFVDNVSSGGCACGVMPGGVMRDEGCGADLWRISAHPTGVAFAGRRLPGFDRAVETACALQRTLPQFALLAWDFAVDEDAQPVLIEVNIGGASIDFMQICNGPLFGDYTGEVLERVYREPLSD